MYIIAPNFRSVIAMQARSRAKSSRGAQLTEDQQRLVASALRLLASIPALCSPAGTPPPPPLQRVERSMVDFSSWSMEYGSGAGFSKVVTNYQR